MSYSKIETQNLSNTEVIGTTHLSIDSSFYTLSELGMPFDVLLHLKTRVEGLSASLYSAMVVAVRLSDDNTNEKDLETKALLDNQINEQLAFLHGAIKRLEKNEPTK